MRRMAVNGVGMEDEKDGGERRRKLKDLFKSSLLDEIGVVAGDEVLHNNGISVIFILSSSSYFCLFVVVVVVVNGGGGVDGGGVVMVAAGGEKG
ncbi:hypothetical protein QVD17_30835 [Tagetes erecta]|uniref:Uncharacterized protein n=1 Tax=Tagetes erecta TaxID=13708 RepID=A0AAD8NGB7_TARER|nr:hypothetical protein QVD17_30835 [Tagetes erecta]